MTDWERVSIQAYSSCKHAIHCFEVNFVYHHRFFSPRRCNTDARGILFNNYIAAHCSLCQFVWQRNLISVKQFKQWLATTGANVAFHGKPVGDFSDLSKRNALDTTVTYCNTQIDNVSGGLCTIYNGGAICLSALVLLACLLLTTSASAIATRMAALQPVL